MAKPKSPVVPDVSVVYRELPGTRVGFWVVERCPYCGGQHFHPAGSGNTDPLEKLGQVEARCAQGQYRISLPPKRKKGRAGKRRKSDWDDWDE